MGTNLRRQLSLAISIVVVVILIAAIGAEGKPHVIRFGNLYLRDDGGIAPSKLPRHRQTPIAAAIKARIGTIDGTHPPAVEALNIDFDRSIRVNAGGLPSCPLGRLEARPTAAAKKACADAIVGSGEGEVEVAFPEQAPFAAKGPIVLFNGGVRGRRTVLFAHAYVSVPAPTAVVATVEITRISGGRYGIRTVTRIPRIAGGAGSVIGVRLAINRRFTDRGQKKSYLTASCPTGIYYTKGEILFAGGAVLRGVHALPCTPVD